MTANPGSSVPYLTQRDHSSAAPKRRAGAPATAAAALVLAAALTLLGATAAAAAPLRTEPVRTEPLRAETPSTAIDQRSGAEGELRRLELAPGDRLAQPFAPLGSGAAAKITVWAEAGSPDDFTIALHAVRGGAVDPEPMPGGTGEAVTLPNTVAPKSSPGAGGETVPGPEVGEGFLPRQLSLADGPQLDAGTAYAIVVTAGGQGARTVFPATASEVAGASALHAPGGGDWAEAPGPSRLLTEVQLWGEAEGEAGSGTPPPTPGADPGEPPVAVPEAPALRCGAAPALELPAVTGVRYDQEQSGTALIATASPEPGFVFPTDARTSWRFLLTVCDREGGPGRGDGGATDPTRERPGSGGAESRPESGSAGREPAGGESAQRPGTADGGADGGGNAGDADLTGGGQEPAPAPGAGEGPEALSRTGTAAWATAGGVALALLLGGGAALLIRSRRQPRPDGE